MNDEARFVTAHLADPTHTLPMPDRVPFSAADEGEKVDLYDGFIQGLLADGSLKLGSRPAAAAALPAASDVHEG